MARVSAPSKRGTYNMRVLKVVAEGSVTSFRYPHFMQGVQPTFEMPPPATIYGHICSALGEWFDPTGVRFAIRFSYKSRFDDIEHTHILARTKSERSTLEGTQMSKVQEGTVQPFRRSLLFGVRLILYLNRPEWAEQFRSPKYALVLGRSQDLFCYRSVEVIDLVESDCAYLEHTLLPYEYIGRTARGVAVLMPRFIDYRNGRYPTFERYVVLHRRISSRDMLKYKGEALTYWIDRSSPRENDEHLGLVFHSWTDDLSDGMA